MMRNRIDGMLNLFLPLLKILPNFNSLSKTGLQLKESKLGSDDYTSNRDDRHDGSKDFLILGVHAFRLWFRGSGRSPCFKLRFRGAQIKFQTLGKVILVIFGTTLEITFCFARIATKIVRFVYIQLTVLKSPEFAVFKTSEFF